MLPELYDDQRASLLRASMMLCSISVLVLPLSATYSYAASARESGAGHRYVATFAPESPSFPPLIVVRDPFVPNPIQTTLANGSPAIVRAVITGQAPRALIESNGATRVVGIGDRIGALHITAIDAGGVTLENGAKLAVPENRQ
jgi:hypothetical protein